MASALRESQWEATKSGATPERFGAGLAESEVRRLQTILREECGADLPMPEVWSRAIEVLSLVEMLLQNRGVFEQQNNSDTAVRASSLLTNSTP